MEQKIRRDRSMGDNLRRLRVPAHFVLTQASKLWLHLQPQRWRAENACDRTRWVSCETGHQNRPSGDRAGWRVNSERSGEFHRRDSFPPFMIEWDQIKSPLQLERAFYLVTRTGIEPILPP